jgi:hypothetical protein
MKLMTVKRAAKTLGLCEITMRKRLIDEGWPFYNLGPKGVRVDVDEILKLTRRKPKLKANKPAKISEAVNVG